VLLEDWHPDLLEFISCKRNGAYMQGANISVGVSDSFMEAVREDRPWLLRFPDTDHPAYRKEWDGNLQAWAEAGRPVKIHAELPARQLWRTLCESAWASAEPGLVFLERSRRESNSGYYQQGQVMGPNPCQPAWAPLSTPGGVVALRSVEVGDLIWQGERWTEVVAKTCTGVKMVRAWRTYEGTFYGTDQHRVFEHGVKVEVAHVKSIDPCALPVGQTWVDAKCPCVVGSSILHGANPILEVEDLGEEEVWSLTVADPSHRYWTGGLLVANCGEQMLPGDAACNLGHLNLSRFVRWASHGYQMDLEALRRAVVAAVRFLDNVIDLSAYPFEEARLQQQLERRIGLGTLGLAEAMVVCGVRYGSPEGVAWAERLYRDIAGWAYTASVNLAVERGPFPAYTPEFWQRPFANRMVLAAEAHFEAPLSKLGIRNVTLLTQAPTGSVGTMCGTTTGIEPHYAAEWERQGRFGKVVERAWVIEANGGERPAAWVSALDLDPSEHVAMQAAVQLWTDSSVSKTANVPAEWTVEQVQALYELMYSSGCKGGTIYRDRSRSEQVLSQIANPPEIPDSSGVNGRASSGVNGRASQNGKPAARVPSLMPCPLRAEAIRVRKPTPSGTAHVIGTMVDGEPCELFVDVGKAGSDLKAMAEALGRLASLVLRLNSDVPQRERARLIAEQLRGIGGPRTNGFGPAQTRSVPDALAMVIDEIWGSGPVDTGPGELPSRPGDLCPECGAAALLRESGCEHCVGCGWSAC
jgi:ribonucleotide reductase alpha subunit